MKIRLKDYFTFNLFAFSLTSAASITLIMAGTLISGFVRSPAARASLISFKSAKLEIEIIFLYFL